MQELGFSESASLANSTPAQFRQTLANSASLCGRGIHSGMPATLTLRPAEPGTGLRFRRVDLPKQPIIPVSYENLAIEELERRTTLRSGEVAVHTIEHVLSALAGVQVHDAVIDLDAAEPPFADGSSLPYAQLIQQAGLVRSATPIDAIVIKEPISFGWRDAEICVIPSCEFRVSFFFTSSHPNLRSQSHTVAITAENYLTEIAPARTFCFFEEIEALRKANLIRGANLSSAVVIGRKGIINDSLRYPDEPVRHKILDFIGDMALLGAPLQGHFMAWRAGHRVNAEFGLYLKKELNL
jgi:UDP-3-O-[3-hydroxymyristoyl] N-acetylglucosamine deacetylase/3-hydroxyacyl-[acyl-carrier-protein] dehydratase